MLLCCNALVLLSCYLLLLLITYQFLLITSYLLLITYYSLRITYYLILITYYLLIITYHCNPRRGEGGGEEGRSVQRKLWEVRTPHHKRIYALRV